MRPQRWGRIRSSMARCGTYSGYVGGCRCDGCRHAALAYNRRRKQKIARPDEVWEGLIPAGPARTRILELEAAGHSLAGLARALDVPLPTIKNIKYRMVARVSRRVNERIMSLIPGAEAGPGRRPAVKDVTPRTLREDSDELDELYDTLADILEDRRAPWRRRAACRYAGITPAIFFPSRGMAASGAGEVCATCPVRADCLTYADRVHIQEGMWGGIASKDRRPSRRRVAAAS